MNDRGILEINVYLALRAVPESGSALDLLANDVSKGFFREHLDSNSHRPCIFVECEWEADLSAAAVAWVDLIPGAGSVAEFLQPDLSLQGVENGDYLSIHTTVDFDRALLDFLWTIERENLAGLEFGYLDTPVTVKLNACHRDGEKANFFELRER